MKGETREYRFFVDSLGEGRIALPASEAHHAARVLRLETGDSVCLLDGRGGSAIGRLVEIKKGHALVEVEQLERTDARGLPRVHLAFAVPKGKRLDWLLEKACELGAASLQAVIFSRSVAGGDRLNDSQRERWRGHCIAAAKQAGLRFLPEIHQPTPLAEYLTGKVDGEKVLVIFGDAAEDATAMSEVLAEYETAPPADIRLLVGPEGGFTDAERQQMLASGCRPVRIGRTTLRVETAALALLASVQAILGSGQAD